MRLWSCIWVWVSNVPACISTIQFHFEGKQRNYKDWNKIMCLWCWHNKRLQLWNIHKRVFLVSRMWSNMGVIVITYIIEQMFMGEMMNVSSSGKNYFLCIIIKIDSRKSKYQMYMVLFNTFLVCKRRNKWFWFALLFLLMKWIIVLRNYYWCSILSLQQTQCGCIFLYSL